MMDLIIFRKLFGKGKKRKENISGLWPPRPSLTESQASKEVAHGKEANKTLTGELSYS